MSWYYTYYAGYKSAADGKIYPIGPYNSKGKLKPIICNSRSFEPKDLDQQFYGVNEDLCSDELKKAFNCEDESDLNYISYLPVEELPSGNYLRTGYYLIEDVKLFESGKCGLWDDIFFDCYTTDTFLAKAESELRFGKPKDPDEDYHPCADYMKFSYIDYTSAEYAAEQLRRMVNILNEYNEYDGELVIILTQG